MQMMTDTTRSFVYFLMGLGSLAMSFYAASIALSLTKTSQHYSSSLPLCLTIAIVFILVGAVNFYTAYGFKFGRVDEVVGSLDSAIFRRSGRNVREGVRIQLVRVLGTDDLSLTHDERRVLFISGWLPWVCKLSKFHCQKP
ncbi:hypothetical protein [Massilia violaceinigra]|uniref:hypothetical protein n=1 Tax=Massilia violaceinigra TaxID=2045208 RepID=UPI001ABF8660|nr:hypothetical protein [Massilia violaceinigra]